MGGKFGKLWSQDAVPFKLWVPFQYLSNSEYLSSTFQTVGAFPVHFKYLSNCESIPFLTIQPGYQYLCSTFQTVSSLSFYTSLYPFLFWNWECDIVSPIKLWLFPCLDLILLLSENLSRSHHFYMSCQPLGKWATESVENPCKTKFIICQFIICHTTASSFQKSWKLLQRFLCSVFCICLLTQLIPNKCQMTINSRNRWFPFFEPSINRTRPF